MNTLKSQLKAFEQKQIIASIFVLVVLLGASIILNFVNASNRADQATKLVSRMIQTNNFREVTLTLQEARISYFKKIEYKSEDPRRRFTLPQMADFYRSNSISHQLMYADIELPIESIDTLAEKEAILFEFNRYALFPYAFAIWLLLNLVSIPQTRYMKRKIQSQYEKDLQLNQEAAYGEIARKVRHNIRTPLAALMRLSNGTKNLSEEQRDLYQGIVSQIQNLISNMDSSVEKGDAHDRSYSLFESIQQSIQENKLALPSGIKFRNRVEDSIGSIKANFVPHEFRSIIANLINNSVEALKGVGQIELHVSDQGATVTIDVIDNGPGMSAKIIAKATEKGFSFGKTGGTGIGLYHAAQMMREWNGRLKIESSAERTCVSFSLPILEREGWYISRLKIGENDNIIVVDDQVSIHRLWSLRLSEAGFKGKAGFFFSFDEAREHLSAKVEEKGTHFFIDYDLGSGVAENGIDFLNSLKAVTNRFLVTGHFDDQAIQTSCRERGLGLIPKTALPEVPIVIV